MIDADKHEFVQTLRGLAAMKPGGKLTPETIELFWRSMAAWSLADFLQAATHLARAHEFMPNPYHFEQLRKAGLPTAGEAFARALKHACSGAWRDGPLGDESIDAPVRAIGGYVVIARCEEDKTPFLERRFAEHYEAILDARATREALPQLTESTARLSEPRRVAVLLPARRA